MLLDMFGTFIAPLEQELGIKANTAWGAFRHQPQQGIHDRIEAINFSLAHDDGQAAATWPGRRDPGGREAAAARTPPACTWPCSSA